MLTLTALTLSILHMSTTNLLQDYTMYIRNIQTDRNLHFTRTNLKSLVQTGPPHQAFALEYLKRNMGAVDFNLIDYVNVKPKPPTKSCGVILTTNKLAPEYCSDVLPPICGKDHWNQSAPSTFFGYETGLCYGLGTCNKGCTEKYCKPCADQEEFYPAYAITMNMPLFSFSNETKAYTDEYSGVLYSYVTSTGLAMEFPYYQILTKMFVIRRNDSYDLVSPICLQHAFYYTRGYPHSLLYRDPDTIGSSEVETYIFDSPTKLVCEALITTESLDKMKFELMFQQELHYITRGKDVPETTRVEMPIFIAIPYNTTHCLDHHGISYITLSECEVKYDRMIVKFEEEEIYGDPILKTIIKVFKFFLKYILTVLSELFEGLEGIFLIVITTILRLLDNLIMRFAKSEYAPKVIMTVMGYCALSYKLSNNFIAGVLMVLSYLIYTILTFSQNDYFD